MNLTVAYEPITELLRNAYAEGRQFLYEYEVYNLLSLSGSETPPKCSFIPRNARLADEEVMAMPGDKAVLKIVSPTIIHKTEVGGVRIVPKTPDKVRPAPPRAIGGWKGPRCKTPSLPISRAYCRCSSCRPTPKRSAMSLSWAFVAPASSAWSSARASAGPIPSCTPNASARGRPS